VRAFMLGLSCSNHQISEEPHACKEGSMLAREAMCLERAPTFHERARAWEHTEG
jgi:hypothetical protein